jgi:hypothetical protein
MEWLLIAKEELLDDFKDEFEKIRLQRMIFKTLITVIVFKIMP